MNVVASAIVTAIGVLVRYTILGVVLVFRDALRIIFDVERPPTLRAAPKARTSADPVTAQLAGIGRRDPAFSKDRFLNQVGLLFGTLQQARAQGDVALCNGLVAEGLAGQLVGSSQGGPGWMRVTTSFSFEKSAIVHAACRPGVDEITVRIWSNQTTRPSREARSIFVVEDWLFRRPLLTSQPVSGGVTTVVSVGPWMLEAVGHASSGRGRSGFPASPPL